MTPSTLVAAPGARVVPRAQAARRTVPPGLWLMTAYAFWLPVQLKVSSAQRFAPSDVFVLAYALLRFPYLRRVPAAWTSWQVLLVAVIWVALLTGLLRTGHLDTGSLISQAIGILLLTLTYACVVDVATDRSRLRAVLRAFVLGTTVNAVVALACLALLKFAGIAVPLVNEPFQGARLSGLLIDPNAFGGCLAVALVLHVVTGRRTSGLLTGGWGRVATLALPAALALTFSRSAWIGAVLGLGAVVALDRLSARVAIRRLFAPLALALAMLPVLVSGAGSLSSRPQQVTARLDIGTQALHDWFQSPATGIGLGVFQQRHGLIVHNSTLWLLCETGVVGLAAFLGFLWTVTARGARSVLSSRGADRALAVALIGAVFAGLGLSVGIEALYQRYWWLAFASLGALRALQLADAERAAARRAVA